MFDQINISNINDFIFCPISIYYHNCYGTLDSILYQKEPQLNGKSVHSAIDNNLYSKETYISSLSVFSATYNLYGKIDLYDKNKKILIERKYLIKNIYDGYVFQLYAQYFAMTEMGNEINSLIIRSYSNNKNYSIALPKDNPEMLIKFNNTINRMHNENIESFIPQEKNKCDNCIYSELCDRTIL